MKALTKTTSCTCRAKNVQRHDKKILGMCSPLSNSFRRHWGVSYKVNVRVVTS